MCPYAGGFDAYDPDFRNGRSAAAGFHLMPDNKKTRADLQNNVNWPALWGVSNWAWLPS